MRLRSLLVVVLLAALTVPAAAELCVIDAVPAATVLVPYFEVDLRNAGKSKFERTKVTLINTQPAPAIVHVILWTDLSIPTLNFDIFLTGYDVQEFDVDRLFTDGVLPIPASQPNGTSGCTSCGSDGCVNISPGNDFTLTDLINAHTGSSVGFYDGQCMARSSGRVARGYITFDNVSECTRLYPGDSGYFENGGNGIANNLNSLKATITTYSNKFLREVPAIAIEAGTSSGLSTDGNFTFYGRYTNFDASDNRECGGTEWAMPYRKRDRFKTEAIVWRDSGVAQGPFSCSDLPEWYPLDESQVVVFNQQEDVREITQGGVFPAETQLVSVGKSPINTGSFDAGWAYFNLQTSVSSASTDDFVGHGYVIARQRYRSREGDAWAQLATVEDVFSSAPASTVCGQPVPPSVRARARQSREAAKGGKGTGRGKKRVRVDSDGPRPPQRPE